MAQEEKILVIDDDEMVNDVLTFILEEEFSVKSYLNAEDALNKEEISKIDVIITDVNLPGMDGIEFLKKVHSVDANIPVIVVTGFNDIDVAISALKNGAFDFILKPFKNDQITLSVNKAMERRRLLHEKNRLMEELQKKNTELEILNKKIQARNLEIENELDIASNLQKCIFPVVFPEIQKFQFALKFHPVEKISGDFFDFIISDQNHFAFVFGDVSGHGVPAALYSAMVKTAISTVMKNTKSPSQTISEMNKFLIQSQRKMSYNYATVFYGAFDLERNKLIYCNAGIPSPIIIRDGGDVDLLEPNGPFVGIFDTSVYEEVEVDIKPGDKIIFYTDGSYECTNSEEELLGQKNFLEFLWRIKAKGMHAIVTDLFSEVELFCANERYVDDITILGMYYNS